MRPLDLLSPLRRQKKVLLHGLTTRLRLGRSLSLQALTLCALCMLGLSARPLSLALKPGLPTGLRLALSHVTDRCA